MGEAPPGTAIAQRAVPKAQGWEWQKGCITRASLTNLLCEWKSLVQKNVLTLYLPTLYQLFTNRLYFTFMEGKTFAIAFPATAKTVSLWKVPAKRTKEHLPFIMRLSGSSTFLHSFKTC
jgi:hypothetical protein